VEGPWVDETSKSLWIHRVHDGSLLRLDETGWHLVALPAPPKGYYSRGDMSEGFRGMSDTSGFRLVGGGGYVWGWSPPDHWILETAPSAPEFSALVGVGFFRGREIRVMRLEFCPPRSCNYAFYRRDGHGWSGGRDLPVGQVRQVLGTADGIFARSDTGELVRFDDNGAVVLETPGKCEAIARTSADKLMASFVGAGVFTLTQDGWTKVLDYPHGSSEGEHFALLAEENGVVAYATSSKPRLVGSASRAKWEYSGSTALWVSEGGKWVRIDAEKAVRP
jgi:hypothetical protein